MSFDVKFTPSIYAASGAALLFLLWFGLRFYGKDGHPNPNSDDKAKDSWKLPRGVSVYTCDSLKSYESLPSYLNWITQRKGLETKAVILHVCAPISDESSESHTLIRVVEFVRNGLLLAIVTSDDDTADLLSEASQLKQAKQIHLFESMPEAIDFLEIELS